MCLCYWFVKVFKDKFTLYIDKDVDDDNAIVLYDSNGNNDWSCADDQNDVLW